LHLVRARTTQILSAENQYVRQTGQHLNSNAIKRLTDETVRKMGLPIDVEYGLCATVSVIQALSAQIEVLEARLLEANVGTKEWALINSVPGIGKVLGIVILLEVGSIGRFACAGRFASYARCVDSARMSNGKKKGEGNSKNGNQHLSWAFVEAAHFAARFSTQAKQFYDRKKARTNTAVATKALAHKLARAVFHVLRDGVPFDAKRCFGG